MIRSIIEYEDGVTPPVNALLIELEHQLPQVYLHDLSCGVGLGEGQVDIAKRIQGNYHGDSRLELHYRQGVG